MIFVPIIYIFGIIISLLAIVLTWIGSVLIPTTINDAFIWFFAKINLFNGIFPTETLLTAGLFVLSIWIAKYTFKFGLWLISFIPFIKYQELPHMSESRSESTSRDQFGNVRTTKTTSTTKKKGYFRR